MPGRRLNKGLTTDNVAVIGPELIKSVVIIMAQRPEWRLRTGQMSAFWTRYTHRSARLAFFKYCCKGTFAAGESKWGCSSHSCAILTSVLLTPR